VAVVLLAGSGLASWAATAQPPATPAAALPPGEPLALKPLASFTEHPDWVTSVAYSPDGKLLATGTYEAVKLWDLAEKQEVAAVKSKGFIRSVAFSPDGKLLATGSYQNVTLWDVASRTQQSVLAGHRGYVTGAAFSPDGKWLATSCEDETAKLWDVAAGKEVVTLRGHAYPVTAIAISPAGNLLATAAGDVTRVTRPGEVTLWDIPSGHLRLALPPHERVATAVAFSPDGKLLASGSLDETVRLWDVAAGKELRTYEGHSRPVNCVTFSPDGKLVASGSGGRFVNGNELRVWDARTGADKAVVEFEARVTAVAFAPGGKTLATGSYDKTATVWDASPLLALADPQPAAAAAPKELRAGIIGLDTSHATAFTKILNDPAAGEDVAHCKVVAAYPKGSPDIESSVSRVPEYTKVVQTAGVEIVDSIEDLLKKVDVVFLETNDGRPHLEQVLPVLKAGKPVFVDKPIAGSLADAIAIFEAAEKYKVPLFSSSSLRFTKGAQALRGGKIGDIIGCDAYSPCSLDKTHPDLFWYGIHGVETLFTVMGTGCESVSRVSTPGLDVAVGTWKGGRVGTFRGIRQGTGGYGGTAFGTKGIEQIGPYESYRPLLVEIVKCFRTGVVPIEPAETLEIYAFMEAADESKRQGGKPVTLESVMTKAREEVRKRAAAAQ
jgi:uncharacterized protein with WD repeat